jgi:microcystin-dependent protein
MCERVLESGPRVSKGQARLPSQCSEKSGGSGRFSGIKNEKGIGEYDTGEKYNHNVPKEGMRMSDPFLGEIIMFGGNFAPRGWAFCNGQLMSIAQNTALFSILGTTYGGDGQTTFALPDLRGRVPVHSGSSQGPGLPPVQLGEMAGFPSVTILQTNMPPHNHLVAASQTATTADPNGAVPASLGRDATPHIYAAQPDGTHMNPTMISMAGGGQPISVQQPYLGVNFIIALEGIFPSRS